MLAIKPVHLWRALMWGLALPALLFVIYGVLDYASIKIDEADLLGAGEEEAAAALFEGWRFAGRFWEVMSANSFLIQVLLVLPFAVVFGNAILKQTEWGQEKVAWLIKNQMRVAPLVFLLPALLFFAVYVVYPILQSFWVSFHEWDGLSPDMEFVGLSNYVELIRDDPDFWTAIINNILWLVLFMLAPVFGLAIALFLNQTVFGIRLIKSLFFFPFVISQVVVGLVFSWFYDPANGLLNAILGVFGVPEFSILSSPGAVTFGIIAAGLWPQTAYCMIIYLTGLNNINAEQIEAARIDGANGWTLLQNVILPQLRPATFLAVVITVIGALRSFDLIAIMTNGGPFGSSTVLAFKMYEEAIYNYRQGYGAAVAVVLFLIMSVYIAFFLTRMVRQER